jgi:putative CocE/NonD family hydrolase
MKGNNTVPAAGPGVGEGEEPARSLDENAAEDGGAWLATREWPPSSTSRRALWLDGGHSDTVKSVNDGVLTLGPETPRGPLVPPSGLGAGADVYAVNYSSAMGTFSRWMNGYGARRKVPARTTFFDERTSEDAKALTWTSPPLGEPLTIVGYPTVRLWVSSTHTDGDVFAYLEEIDDRGAAHYVTEGAIRASHRANRRAPWSNFGLPWHRSYPNDLQPLTKGEPTRLDFDLEGTAIVIDAGHRIRLALTGADRANYELWPDPEGKDAPTITVYRGGDHASYVVLPIATGGTT